MQIEIETWNTAVDGPMDGPGMLRKFEARGFHCTMYTYPAGTRFPDHAHDVDKIDGVVEGRFEICMDGRHYLLGPGDSLFVPGGRVHNARVVGNSPVVSIDAWRPRT